MNAKLFEEPKIRVPESQELLRILRMPRRTWTDEEAEDMAEKLTALLKTPHGTMRLRPLQAVALCEIGMFRGLAGPLRCGQGKTLVGFLAPAVTFAERPLLVIPAKLVKKTKHDYQELSVHWKIPPFIRIMTFEWLGRVQASPIDEADALEQYNPDLFVIDEAHKVRNKKAAVTRRVVRFFRKFPDVPCIVMSGTFMKRSLHDFAHTIRWTHDPQDSPLPADFDSLDKWADALDERQNQQKVCHPGALEMFCNDEERQVFRTDPHRAARLAFRRRFVETRGVVASYETPIDATLTVEGVEYEPGASVDEAFALMRRDWVTPDGWPIDDAMTVARHAFEFALGFYLVWDPRPPREWLEARKAWFRFVRETLAHSRTLDSTKHVALAYPEEETYLAWKRVEKTFVPNTRPVWVDDAALEFCAAWGEREKSFVWVKHVEFGKELSRRTGWPYYRRKGLCNGVLIDNHPRGYPAIASIKANDEGRNLQAWSTSLITAPPANGIGWEQILSRLHRDGQEADEVQFDVLVACVEHAKAVEQARSDARTVQDLTGSPQKLLLAAVNVPAPETLVFRPGARWSKYAA